MTTTTLDEKMHQLYVDHEGATIVEAVQLGNEILNFFTELHATIECAISCEERAELFHIINDFYISLGLESFSLEAYNHNKDAIGAQIETIKDYHRETGMAVQDCVTGSFLRIVQNEFFQDPSCNIILRVLLVEAITRNMNAHYYCIEPIDDKHSESQNVFITYSNMQASFHSLAMIAFLCSGDQAAYMEMNRAAESYANKMCSELAHVIIRAVNEY